MAVHNLKLLGGGAVRGSEQHPADDDDLASEKGHLPAKWALFPHDYRGGGAARYGPGQSKQSSNRNRWTEQTEQQQKQVDRANRAATETGRQSKQSSNRNRSTEQTEQQQEEVVVEVGIVAVVEVGIVAVVEVGIVAVVEVGKVVVVRRGFRGGRSRRAPPVQTHNDKGGGGGLFPANT